MIQCDDSNLLCSRTHKSRFSSAQISVTDWMHGLVADQLPEGIFECMNLQVCTSNH